eukprot:GHUV01037989.1.p1 GENE.GHUV01037989.1~~GHUV01037989.1.p1  ORF type:complete len:108 (+),score=22.54 GHUV01037989.1:68-391(+)
MSTPSCAVALQHWEMIALVTMLPPSDHHNLQLILRGYSCTLPPSLQYYVSGDWQSARKGLEACLYSRTNTTGQQTEDGPSRTLLDVMAAHEYQAPVDWHGVRELTEK